MKTQAWVNFIEQYSMTNLLERVKAQGIFDGVDKALITYEQTAREAKKAEKKRKAKLEMEKAEALAKKIAEQKALEFQSMAEQIMGTMPPMNQAAHAFGGQQPFGGYQGFCTPSAQAVQDAAVIDRLKAKIDKLEQVAGDLRQCNKQQAETIGHYQESTKRSLKRQDEHLRARKAKNERIAELSGKLEKETSFNRAFQLGTVKQLNEIRSAKQAIKYAVKGLAPYVDLSRYDMYLSLPEMLEHLFEDTAPVVKLP